MMWNRQSDTAGWAYETFRRCDLGDVRRTRRVVKLAGQLAAHVGQAPVRACRGDAAASEGAYRLLRNEAVDPEAIAAGGFAATAQALALSEGVLLALEDTTVLSYGHAVVKELGDLGGPVHDTHRGFYVHSVLLLEAGDERTLGLIEQTRWCRPMVGRGRKHQRSKRAYEDKESFKWQRAGEQVTARLGSTMARVVSVCDREADIYEYLRYKLSQGERFVVRASWDRRVTDESCGLFELMSQAPVVGSHCIELKQRGGRHGRKARAVKLTVRAARVNLRAPKRAPSLGEACVNAVWAQEDKPPDGVEPLRWLLLTSEPIDDFAGAREVLRYYALRWRVEDFHKAWKSGTRVEERRMQSAGNLERTAVILAFVAVRLLQLQECAQGRQAEPSTNAKQPPCTTILTDAEWQILWLAQEHTRPPKRPPSLRWAYESIAKLGGWLDTKRTGRAGWDAMWQGWFRLQERVDAYLTARDVLQ